MAVTVFFASLVHALPVVAADRVIADSAQGGIRIQVVEKQPPGEPQHGVSLQATHELSVKASANGVQITKLQITPGSNVDSTSGGNPVSGYLYLDAMPEKTLRALVLAADSAQPFNWSYRIEYQVNGQSQSAQRSVESSRPRVKSSGAAMPPMDLSALLADPSATGPSAGEATKMSSPAGNLAVLLADPVAPSHRASATAGEAATESAIDESLRNALTLRDQERDRKAYVARAESLRGGLLEEQKLLREMVATASREHVQIDERRAEAERRRRAEARSSQDNKLMLALGLGMGGAALANKAGFANAGEIGARLGTNIAQGNAAGGISEYSSAMNSGMSQRLATLEAKNRQAMAAQPQQLTDGQQMYRDSVRRSEVGRQQLIAQGKLPNTPPPPTVTAALAPPRQSSMPLSGSGSGSTGGTPEVTQKATIPAAIGTPPSMQRVEYRPDCQVTAKLTNFEGEVKMRNNQVHVINYYYPECLAAKKVFIEAYSCNKVEMMAPAQSQCSSACGDPNCRNTRYEKLIMNWGKERGVDMNDINEFVRSNTR